MDKTAIISNVRRYAQEVHKALSPDAIVLFGSYANGTANEDSDIDVAVIMDEFKGNRLEASAKLCNLTWGIDTRIEPILLDKATARNGFVNEVLRTGELIIV